MIPVEFDAENLARRFACRTPRAGSSVLPVKPCIVRCRQPANVLRECLDELVARVPVALQLDGENLRLSLRLSAFGFRVAG